MSKSAIYGYAIGVISAVDVGLVSFKPVDPVSKQMCSTQLYSLSSQTVSHSFMKITSPRTDLFRENTELRHVETPAMLFLLVLT